MNPELDVPPKKPEIKHEHEVVKDDAYAQSLLAQVNAEYAAKEANKPQVKHVISKRALIYIVISTILTLLASALVSYVSKHH